MKKAHFYDKTFFYHIMYKPSLADEWNLEKMIIYTLWRSVEQDFLIIAQ